MNLSLTMLQIQEYLKAFAAFVFPASTQDSPSGDSVRRTVPSMADSLGDAGASGLAHVQTVSTPPPGWEAGIFLHELLSALVPIAVLITLGILVWKRLETRKAIELAMIEKGLDPRGRIAEKDSTRKFRALRFGLLLVGAGSGLCVAMILWNVFSRAIDYDYRPLVALTSVAFFSGLALTVYHIIATSLEKR